MEKSFQHNAIFRHYIELTTVLHKNLPNAWKLIIVSKSLLAKKFTKRQIALFHI